ncbi:hypothetical protein JOQ06_023613 [Pogonophryne albipinna]|uniref:UV-stimulated scaffold protein A n=1 Tax=Pogonophryne albipinna TaxID=1090488 RepID=A0AAD6FT02_9TELE|nr:hypothetical protein JOQ06_023613 [Pogonophryne albipinna]
MELSQRDRLSELVEELTTSGQPQLHPERMKEVKRICRASNDCIEHVYNSVMSQLNQEHAEVRLSAFQIAMELFSRSHHFRTLLVDNFQEFLELTVETDSEQPLPPPKEVARKLRAQAIQAVQSWQASYGTAYKKLALGFHFLKQVKKVDFQDAEARTERVEAASTDMEESYQEIEATLTEMESCMSLLIPGFHFTESHTANSSPPHSQPANEPSAVEDEPCCSKDLQEERTEGRVQEEEEEKNNDSEGTIGDMKEGRIQEEEEKNNDSEGTIGDMKAGRTEERDLEGRGVDDVVEKEGPRDENAFIRSSGLISHSYNLDLNLSPGLHVRETEDNEAVVTTVIDLHRLIMSKHLPAVQSWVQSCAEQRLLQRALDLKRSLETALQKHKELHIDYKTRQRRVVSVPPAEC